VKHYQIPQPDTDTAQPHRETRRLVYRQYERSAGLAEPRAQPADADLAEHGNRRNVERHLQRAANGDRALERQIEIFRRIVAVSRRLVVDQRLWMNETVFEAQTINEGLQSRTRRPQRLRHVDLAGAARIRIV